ncbi:MAG: hypothetical protein ACK5RO_02935 [Pseudobdellovibrionaceae bacterium]|jgi:hypothetical protein
MTQVDYSKCRSAAQYQHESRRIQMKTPSFIVGLLLSVLFISENARAQEIP